MEQLAHGPQLLSLCSRAVCVSCSVVSDSLWPHGLYSLSGSSVRGIFQARILEWVAISCSRVPSQPRDRTRVSCIAVTCFTIWATREALGRHNYWAYVLSLLKPVCPRPSTPQREAIQWEAWALQLECSTCSPQPEKSPRSDKDPTQTNK